MIEHNSLDQERIRSSNINVLSKLRVGVDGDVVGLLDEDGNEISGVIVFGRDETNLYVGSGIVRFAFFELPHSSSSEVAVIDTSLDTNGELRGLGLGTGVFGLGVELMRLHADEFDRKEVIAILADGSGGISTKIARRYGFEEKDDLQKRLRNVVGMQRCLFLRLR